MRRNIVMTHITSKPFGKTVEGVSVTLYVFTNAAGNEVAVCSYGGSIVSIKVPDRDGKLADVVLGYDDLTGYESRKFFYGASIGRCGNRINKGRFTLNGKQFELNCNEGNNHLHGGFKGFDTKVWDCTVLQDESGEYLSLHLESPDGDENYPGNLSVTMTYSFSNQNELKLQYTAVSDADTICNLTNHSYFNLAGHDSGSVLDQSIKIYADKFTEVDKESIPTGNTPDVAGTPLDFHDFHRIGERINANFDQLIYTGGYDHNWVLSKGIEKLSLCAELYDEKSGRHMSCYTTCPDLHFYTGNFINGSQKAKGGFTYLKRAGLCFESQFAPDAVNHPQWESPVLKAGRKYDETTIYKFDVK